MVGWILDMFLSQGPITMSLIVIVVVFQLLLFRSRWGLRTRAVGEHPRAAETAGIDVIWIRYRNVILSGTLAGLAGAYLSLEGTNSFQQGMTAGRGFIGLAAMIVGRWSPLGAFGAALLFSSTTAIGYSISIFPRAAGWATSSASCPASCSTRCPTSSPSSCLRASSAAASRPPPTGSRTNARRRPDERRPREWSGRRRATILDIQEGRGPVPLLDDEAALELLRSARVIAVVGASSRPVPAVLRGLRVPAPPGLRADPGEPVRDLGPWRGGCSPLAEAAAVASGQIDIVDVFRRPAACPGVAEEAVAVRARALWLQLGVISWEAARIAAAGGLGVVMDRCTAIEHRRLRMGG